MPALKRVTQEAARWFARLQDAPVDDAIHGRFEAWLDAHPAHAAEYQALCQVWQDLDAPDRSHQLAQGLEAQRSRRQRRRVNAFTAVLLLGLCALAAPRGWNYWQNQPQQQLAFTTNYGEVRTQDLPDGSQITLGADSRVQLTYTRRERRLELARGEAQFEVRHETARPNRPFVVDAGAARVSVLGTRFVVARSAQAVDVSVSRGRTRVDSTGVESGPTSESLILEAGQSAQVLPGQRPQRVQRDIESADDFTHGRIVFRHASLQEIAETLSRYRARPVRTRPSADGPRIDAVVQAQGVEGFLEVLPRIAAVRVQQTPLETRLLPRPR